MRLTQLATVQLLLWNMLEKYHQDPDAVFRGVHLDPELMYQPGARYAVDKVNNLWEASQRLIKDPCFGLTAAQCWHPSYLGSLGYALLVSTTLRIVLERLIRFHKVVSDVQYAEIYENKDHGTLVFIHTHKDMDSYLKIRADASFAWLLDILRVNFQKDFSPVSINLRHSRPACVGKYYELFQCPVNFDSPVSSMELPLDVIDQELPGGNRELAELNDQMTTKYLATLDGKTLIARVKKFIVEHLPSGNATLENVASDLHYSTRTLQRLLQEEETTFISLLNETRMELAKQYIQDKNMDLIEIAFLLGFSEQSTFSRSFKRWTGKSPGQYRKVA